MTRPVRLFRFSAWVLLGSGLAAAAEAIPLIEAVKQHDRIAVNALLDRGADVGEAEADGSTALHWAAQRDDLELVETLLDAGADVNAATRFGVRPLSLASNNGNAAVVTRLLEAGADPNATSREDQTPLMTAAMNGRTAAIEALLAHGADSNAVESYRGQTALMWAAGEGNVDAVRLLIENGADVAARSKSGFTPLLFAVRNARIGTLRVLLDSGANVNDIAPDGTSALNVATVNAFYEVASVLLEHDADPNLPDARGSPLHSIAWLRQPGVTGDAGVGELPRLAPRPTGNVTALELAARLLEHGADPNVRIDWEENRFDPGGGTARNPPGLTLGRHLLTYNGATAFYVAAKNGDAPLMRLLADGGADPLIPNRFGITPLMMAAGMDTWEGETPGPFTGVSEAERLDAVKLAIELGDDINAVADFGDFTMTGDPEYTLLYYPHNLDELADLGTGDPRWSGSTALHGAIISNQPSIVQYLVDRGATLDARTETGWTPLMMTRGVFLTNTGREFPAAEAILVGAFRERGLPEQ
ncbi:ankyrin repeat domain-containing protein [Candidatus Rariloculus sp.]|uniref:ankyrin repeat domain-containing protein n=1 Tax=Candidatus Rariloculus sp. TaxID=3101265 RepID=UPI003D143F55